MFGYLLLSIMLFNLYFTYPNYQVVLDKLFLIFAMLALINTYMQYESKENIAKALCAFLYPFKWFGFDPSNAALLFITTLDKVEKLKQDINIKKFRFLDANKSAVSFEQIACRLASYIQELENSESEQI